MIAEIDKDGSGQQEPEEFLATMATRPTENESGDEMQRVLVTYDLARTGFISLPELRKVPRILENARTMLSSKKWSTGWLDGDQRAPEDQSDSLLSKKGLLNDYLCSIFSDLLSRPFIETLKGVFSAVLNEYKMVGINGHE